MLDGRRSVSLKIKILLPLLVIAGVSAFYDVNLFYVLTAYSFIAYALVKLVVVGPMEVMRQAIERQQRGDKIVDSSTPGQDEISELTERMNELLTSLSESEEAFRQMAETIHAAFWIMEAGAKKYIYVSPGFEKIWSIPCAALYRNSHVWPDSIVREDRGRMLKAVKNIAGGGFDLEYRIKRPNGVLRWVHDRGYPVKDDFGRVIRLVGVATDITKRKKTEEALKDSEHYNREVFEQSPVGLLLCRLDGTIVDVNSAYTRIIGRTVEETLSIKDSDIASEEYVQEDQEQKKKLLETGRYGPYEKEYVHKQGHMVQVRLSGTLIYQNGEKFILSCVEDITERVEAEEALKKYAQDLEVAKSKALQAAQAKGEFLANMSHEIRTPMNGVMGMLELLTSTELGKEQNEYAVAAYRSAEALLDVINDVLDFSKIEAGKMDIGSAPFDLRATIEDVVQLLALKTEAKGIELVFRYAPDASPIVEGDARRIRQVVVNLLGNAIKFTHEGYIYVNVEIEDRNGKEADFRIEVQDTGIGVPEKSLAGIFDSFTQVDASSKRRYSGTGLGLAICKQLVELMKGRIQVTSELGKGSNFAITVPLVVDQEADQKKPTSPLAEKRVAIVDDSRVNRQMMVEYFSSKGAKCKGFKSGKEFLEALASSKEKPYQIMIVDDQMPHMDGLRLGRALQSEPRWKAVQMIMMSTFSRRNQSTYFKEVGFFSTHTKPVKMAKLESDVTAALDLIKDTTAEKLNKPYCPQEKEEEQKMKPHVLLAEDNEVNRTVAIMMLNKIGCRVDIAVNGKEALDKVKTCPYSMIFMDCQMPEMDGYAATKEIRLHDEKRGIRKTPIVAMTANALEGDREKCLQAGMDDYISKPIKSDRVEEAVQKWVSPIDKDTLESLRALDDGQKGLMAKLMQDYIRDTQARLKEICQAYEKKDGAHFRKLAHTVQGSSGNIGAKRMQVLAAEMERFCQNEDWGSIEAILIDIQDEFLGVEEMLRGEKDFKAAA